MWTSVPQMPVFRTRIRTSLMPIWGVAMSSSQSPGSRLLLTRAFMDSSTITRCRLGGLRYATSVKHLLLFAATTGYQIRVFADAARHAGAEVTLATGRCHIMEDPWADRAIPVKFDRIAESLEVLRGLNLQVDGVAAVGDQPAVLAAEAAAMFGV